MQERPEEEQFSITDWTRIIFRRWKVIAAAFTIVFFISFPVSFYNASKKAKMQKPVYTASTKIIIGPESLEVTTREGGLIRRIYSYSSELSLLSSNIIARQAAGILKEKPDYQEFSIDKLTSGIKAALTISTPDAKGERGKNMVWVSATALKPQWAYDAVDAVVEGYQKQKREDEQKFFDDTYRTFNEQLDAARQNLHQAENVLTDFIMENEEIAEVIKSYGVSEGKGKGVLAVDSGINEKYLKLKSEISAREEFIDGVKGLAVKDKLAALSLIAKNYDYLVDLNLKKTLIAKEEELNNLLLVNEEAHPEVIRARGELESIWNKIDTEIEGSIKNIELDMDILKSQEKKLSDLIAAGAHKKIISYNMLRRDIGVKQEIYNKLAEELQRLDLGEKLKRYSEIRVLEPARMPTSPSNPMGVDFSQIIIFSLAMAAFGSAVSVYVVEMMDTSIKDVEQLEDSIGIPVLVSIPWYRKGKPPKKEGRGLGRFFLRGGPKKDQKRE